jgi:anti-sigma28 factor (negative regulator of flagellin synthesis)
MLRQPPRIKTWREQAEEALAAGNEQEWFRLVNTNYVVNPQSWSELDKNMAWIPALRRPAFGPRFGIGAVYHNPPKDFEGSPQPIGSSELTTAMSTLQQNAGGSGGGSGGETRRTRRTRGTEGAAPGGESAGVESPSQGPESRSSQDSELTYYTGDFGSKLVEALKERIESGAYGAIYREMAQTASRGPRQREYPNNPGDASGELAGLAGGTPEGGVDQPTGHSPTTTDHGAKRLGIAVVWLGKAGSKEELLRLAQDANVDVLVTYEISLQTNKQISLVRNITKMKITTAKRDEPLFTSTGLENRLVVLARNKSSKAEDPVDQEVEKTIEALDKVVKPAPLPAAVTGDAIKRRLAMVIEEKPADKLPAVVEARYYAAKGLISHDEAMRVAMSLLGDAEYAEMILSTPFEPGSQQGLGQMVGRGLSLPGVLDVLSAANQVTGQTARNEDARKRQAADKPPAEPAAGGVRSLLPFGFGGQKK